MHKGASLVHTWAGVLTNHPYRLNNVLDQSRKKKTFSYILEPLTESIGLWGRT